MTQVREILCRGIGQLQGGRRVPERKLYTVGEKVGETVTKSDGTFQLDLPAGNYFVRVFYGEKSYSGDVLIDLEENRINRIGIGLIHGI